MPQGKGTYGSTVGRPPKKAKVKGYAEGDKVKKEGKFDLPDYIKTRRAKRKKEGKWVFGKYAGKAMSAVKRGFDPSRGGIKTKEQQMKIGQKSKDPKVRKGTEAGYKKHTEGIAKKKADARKKLESPEFLGSAAYKRSFKLGVSTEVKKPKSTYKKEKPAEVSKEGKGESIKTETKTKPVQTKAQKTAANKSWKRATAASKKAGVKMSDLISQRKKHKKGTAAYSQIQNKINEFYGVKKRHKVEKKQFGGRIPAQQARTGMRPPIAGPSRGYSKGGQVTSEGYPVHGESGNYKVGE